VTFSIVIDPPPVLPSTSRCSSIFLDLSRLSHPQHSRDFLDVHHSVDSFSEKARCATERVSFDGSLRRRLWAMKTKMVLDGCDDSNEKIRRNHANYLKIYHANEFMSLLKFGRSNHYIS
jgi:hypothetical protein